MFVTRETDYAIRILRTLADGQRHNIAELCESEDVPRQFAYKIMKKLSSAGYINSVRGAGGGCKLSIDLGSVSLYNLIEVTDPERVLACCLKDGEKCDWKKNHDNYCSVHKQLCRIQRVLDTELKALSLKQLLEVS